MESFAKRILDLPPDEEERKHLKFPLKYYWDERDERYHITNADDYYDFGIIGNKWVMDEILRLVNLGFKIEQENK